MSLYEYARGEDYSEAVRRACSINSVTKERRLNSFLECNIEGIYLNGWLNLGFIPGPISVAEDSTQAKKRS